MNRKLSDITDLPIGSIVLMLTANGRKMWNNLNESQLLSLVFDDLSTKSRSASAHKNTNGLPILFLRKD
jgi:hypothetical protein